MITNLKIFKRPELIADYLLSEIIYNINTRKSPNESFFLALSGGNTPKILFTKLAASSTSKKINWKKLQLLWVDERCVLPNEDESNFGNAKKMLIDKVSIPARNIHQIKGEGEPEIEIKRYAEEILSNLPLSKTKLPVIDWTLLGIGSDGHTASIFPAHNLSLVYKSIVGLGKHPQTNQKRITLTMDTINQSKRISIVAVGHEKARILSKINKMSIQNRKYPVTQVRPENGMLEWLVDKDASAYL